jgi:hypothetical protein
LSTPTGLIGRTNKLGEKIPLGKLVQYAQNIWTFTEYYEEKERKQASIKRLFDQAGQIVFLGFAYHRLNLDLLLKHPDHVPLADPVSLIDKVDYYGTGYGISEGDRKYIQAALKKLDNRINNCDISGDKCAEFFKNFWYRLYFQDQIDPK